MTCDQYRNMIREKKFEDYTTAEFTACFSHNEACRPCREWTKNRPKSERQTITRQQAIDRMDRVMSDPETLKEVLNAPENHP